MTSSSSLNQPAILGNQPAGFSPEQAQSAREIKARILAGETIPLADLKSFILSAERDLTKARKVENIKVKQTDVDFF